MRPYKAFYNGKTYELEAASSYAAQQMAAAHFKVKKAYKVTVMLLDVEHSTGAL